MTNLNTMLNKLFNDWDFYSKYIPGKIVKRFLDTSKVFQRIEISYRIIKVFHKKYLWFVNLHRKSLWNFDLNNRKNVSENFLVHVMGALNDFGFCGLDIDDILSVKKEALSKKYTIIINENNNEYNHYRLHVGTLHKGVKSTWKKADEKKETMCKKLKGRSRKNSRFGYSWYAKNGLPIYLFDRNYDWCIRRASGQNTNKDVNSWLPKAGSRLIYVIDSMGKFSMAVYL